MTDLLYADLTYKVRGAFFDVYNELCHLDLSEEGWRKALLVSLQERGIAAQKQVEYELRYKGYRIGRFFIDVLADDKLLLELKSTEQLLPIDEAQIITYLKITGLKLGLLVNFGGKELEIKRVLNLTSQRATLSDPVNTTHTSSEWLYPALTGELRLLLHEVHKELGPGFMHMHYRRATQIELRQRQIPHEVKKEITIQFRQQPIETHETRLLIVDNKVALVPLAVREITPKLKGRLRYYLRLLGLQLGIIANFHAPRLEVEMVRI